MYRESGKALKGVQNDLPMQDLYIRPQGVFCSVSSRQLVNLSRNHFKSPWRIRGIGIFSHIYTQVN